MLTLKQKLFIKRYLETRSATQAATEAYHVKNRNVAGVIGYQNLKKLNIRAEIDNILRLAGIDEDTIAKRLSELVNIHSPKGLKQALKLMNYI